MKRSQKVIFIILLPIVIISGFTLLFLWEHKSLPKTYTSTRYLMPVSASTQATIQQTLDNFWQEYTLQNNRQGENKDSDSVSKSESINSKRLKQ